MIREAVGGSSSMTGVLAMTLAAMAFGSSRAVTVCELLSQVRAEIERRAALARR